MGTIELTKIIDRLSHIDDIQFLKSYKNVGRFKSGRRIV